MDRNADLIKILNALLVSLRLHFRGPLSVQSAERERLIGQLAVIDYLIGESGTLPPEVVTHPGDAIYAAYKDLQSDYAEIQSEYTRLLRENERLRNSMAEASAKADEIEAKIKALPTVPPGHDVVRRDRLTAYRTLSSAVDRLLNNTDAATDDTGMARVREAHRRLLDSGRPE